MLEMETKALKNGNPSVPHTNGDHPTPPVRVSRRRQQRRIDADASQRRAHFVRLGGGTILVLIVLAVGWLVYRNNAATTSVSGEMPGPRGGSNQAQDVNTLVDTAASAFTLSDSEGTSYTVTPGQGRPLLLVSHMGIT